MQKKKKKQRIEELKWMKKETIVKLIDLFITIRKPFPFSLILSRQSNIIVLSLKKQEIEPFEVINELLSTIALDRKKRTDNKKHCSYDELCTIADVRT